MSTQPENSEGEDIALCSGLDGTGNEDYSPLSPPNIEPEDVDEIFEDIFERVREKNVDWSIQDGETNGNATLQILNNQELNDQEVKDQAAKDQEVKDRNNILWEYKKISYLVGKEGSTIAHARLNSTTKDLEKVDPFLRYLFQLYPEILTTKDYNRRSPLQLAVHKGHSEMVQLICESAKEPSALIGNKMTEGNCLHLAISVYPRNKLIDWPVLKLLIESSDSSLLEVRDHQNNTPLHLALKYEYFIDTTAQLDLVKTLVEKNPKALLLKNNEEVTVIQEAGQDDKVKTRPELTPFLYLKHNKKEHNAEGQIPAQNRSRSAEIGIGRSKRVSNKSKAKEHDNIQTMFQTLVSWLKEYILRAFNHKEALELLYGPIPGNQSIALNLLNVNRKISPTEIKKSYPFLVFEDILQHVALPNLLPSSDPLHLDADIHRASTESNNMRGPIHYKEIFDWLKKKNVKRVFEVIIEDDLSTPHEDETIIETLKTFGVEIWNWRKYDISIDTISQAAPNVSTVYLYTSGNNAVLRGWSDETGLRTLQQLKKIVLHVKGCEAPPVSNYVEEFKSRMKHLISRDNHYKWLPKSKLEELVEKCTDGVTLEALQDIAEDVKKGNSEKRQPTIEVVYEKERDRRGVPQALKGQTRDQLKAAILTKLIRNKWFHCINQASVRVQNSDLVGSKNIKVALIDDGVDASHWILRDNIKEGITYCTSTSNNSHIPSSFYSSATGHGTLMATLICDICPGIDLYVAKLDDQNSGGDFNFTAKSAADAVKWAVSKEVDIISMSWTIEESSANKEDLGKLNQALMEAAQKNILLFCAARDEGLENPTNKPYPAASTTSNITIVGAAGPSGAISTWVSMESIDLLFPGLEIREACADRMPADMSAVDGSSTATACATGLAGLLLKILSGTTAEREGWIKDKRHDKIKKIMTNVAGNTKYVQVWDLFDDFIGVPEGDEAAFQKLVAALVFRCKT
ncbi:Subtilisin [Trichoderma lentiforme]|uniref:Subtilisin n=1 Tax=Trichoderma lentiforme TaxID=1567552 RepID=A0A9P5C6N1_9HYPO|nr:Subtilisin [Trichoderma lentiforme]